MRVLERPEVLEVRELRDRAAFDALAPRWDALASHCPDRAGAFVRQGFVAAWLDGFWPGRPWAALWAPDRAALAVTESWARVGGVPARVLSAAANVHSCRLDVARRPGDDAALGAIWDHLRDRMRWDVLVLPDLVAGGATERALSALAARDGMRVGRWASNRSPYLDLAAGWDAAAARFDGDFRRDLARRRRRLAEMGEVRLVRAGGGPEMQASLRAGLALEAAAWKGDAGSAIESRAETRAFYRRLAEHGARSGTLALLFLMAGERRVAFAYCLEEDGWLGILKPGYDPEYRAFAPGRLLVAEAMRELAARGGRELDFLGPDMEWKRDFAPAYREHVWWYAFRPTLGGRLRHAIKFGLVPRLRPRRIS